MHKGFGEPSFGFYVYGFELALGKLKDEVGDALKGSISRSKMSNREISKVYVIKSEGLQKYFATIHILSYYLNIVLV